MKQIVCRLSEDQYTGLKCLASEQKTSVSELIRRAIDKVYGEDMEDMRDIEGELARYQSDPGIGIDYHQHRQEHTGSV